MTFEEPEPDLLIARPAKLTNWWPVAALVTVLVALGAAMSVEVPFYAIAPGGAFEVEPLVHVNDGPNFPPKGEVLLCTVSLKRTTVIEALQGWLDPTIDVVREKAIVPPSGRKKFREFNLQLMATSKQQALGVAFEKLGFDAVKDDGAQVIEVVPKSPAQKVLRPGDIIRSIDGEPTTTQAEAVRIVQSNAPGDTISLTIQRAGTESTRDLTVTLGANPDKPSKGFLGVTMQTHAEFDFPYDVDLDSELIGGNSAGLAFTLEVLDVLTEGELTGGHRIAATGTIELDGSVGEVGGVAQKTVAVKEAGAEVFLVPRGEVKQARKVAGDRLRVEPVRNLDDALRILASLGGNGLPSTGQPVAPS